MLILSSNGQCSETTVVGYKQEDGNFKTQFEGNNTFKTVIITKEVLVFTNKNVDRDGLETRLIYVVGKGDKLSHENNARIEELAKEQKIPTENIREVLSTDNCPMKYYSRYLEYLCCHGKMSR